MKPQPSELLYRSVGLLLKFLKITRRNVDGNLLQNHRASLRLQMRTMSDETERRACDEDFGSEEEADAESYLEDNSSDLMDRLRELEVSTHTRAPCTCLHLKQEVG